MHTFSKVKIGRAFSYNGVKFHKADSVSGECAAYVQIFGGDEIVSYTAE